MCLCDARKLDWTGKKGKKRGRGADLLSVGLLQTGWERVLEFSMNTSFSTVFIALFLR